MEGWHSPRWLGSVQCIWALDGMCWGRYEFGCELVWLAVDQFESFALWHAELVLVLEVVAVEAVIVEVVADQPLEVVGVVGWRQPPRWAEEDPRHLNGSPCAVSRCHFVSIYNCIYHIERVFHQNEPACAFSCHVRFFRKWYKSWHGPESKNCEIVSKHMPRLETMYIKGAHF